MLSMIFLCNSESFSSFSQICNAGRFRSFSKIRHRNWLWKCLTPEIGKKLTNLNLHKQYHVQLQYSLPSLQFFASLARERYEVDILIQIFILYIGRIIYREVGVNGPELIAIEYRCWWNILNIVTGYICPWWNSKHRQL